MFVRISEVLVCTAFLPSLPTGCNNPDPGSAASAQSLLPTPTGVQVVAASETDCASSGVLVQTYADSNLNGVFDSGENIPSSSKVCNDSQGIQGQGGAGAHLTVTDAALAQCANGGEVCSSWIDGQSPQSTVVCNGASGSDGQDAAFELGLERRHLRLSASQRRPLSHLPHASLGPERQGAELHRERQHRRARRHNRNDLVLTSRWSSSGMG